MSIFTFVLFTSLTITVAVLIVYFISLKSSMCESKQDFEFLTHLLSMLENFKLSTKYFQILI